MPEGDTILRAARTLDRALAGHALVSARSTVPGVDKPRDSGSACGKISMIAALCDKNSQHGIPASH